MSATEQIPAWRDPELPIACWTAAAAAAILPVEAESMPAAVFQQTHVSLDVRRVDPSSVGTRIGSTASELDVLAYVRARLAEDVRETDVIPVLGLSGAGKSHLVRWLRNSLDQDKPEDVRVVFVPKHRTSLRGVVQLLLDAFADVRELDDIRDRLLSAVDQSEPAAVLRTKLRNALSVGLEHHADRTDVPDDERDARDHLSAVLPGLLQDGHFGPRYLADGTAIARLVDEKLTGRAADDAVDSAFRFKPEHLTVSMEDLSAASAAAQAAVSALLAPVEIGARRRSMVDVAAQMLNDQLPAALRSVFGVGGDDLKELFVRFREVLAGREDVVLLVEDFAMFQGLQDGLVDAITIHSTESARLSALITVFAVTTGYYTDSMPATLKTRSSAAFEVGEQAGDAATRFAASYLRAVRLGPSELENRHAAGERGDPSCDGCPVVAECHDGFGEVDGEGLFPLSPPLIRRLRETALGGDFNARRFLNQILRPLTVEEHPAIENRSFPSDELVERFGLLSVDAYDFDNLQHRADVHERTRLARMYGPNDGTAGAPRVTTADLPTAVYALAGMAPLGLAGGVPSTLSATTQLDGGAGEVKSGPSPVIGMPKIVQQVRDWGLGKGLTQSTKNEVRKAVHRAIVDRMDMNDGAYRTGAWTKPPAPFFDVSSVILDGEDKAAKVGAVKLDVSGTSSEHVDAVTSLMWLAEKGSWRDVPRGAEAAGRLEVILAGWVQTVMEQLLDAGRLRSDLSAVVEAIEVADALQGVKRPTGRGLRLAQLLVDAEGDATEGDALVTAAAVLRSELRRRVGYARGDGAVVAVDQLVAARMLRETRGGKRLLEVDPVAKLGARPSVEDAVGYVAGRLLAVRDGADALAHSLPDVSVLGGEPPVELARDLAAIAAGKVAAHRIDDMTAAAGRVAQQDAELVLRAANDVARWAELSPLEQAVVAGGPWRGAAERVGSFVQHAESVLEAATPAGTTLGRGERPAAEAAWADALGHAEAAVRALEEVSA